MDMLFGKFWPDAGIPGNVRAVFYCLGVGLLAGIVLPFRDLGLGTFVVLLAAGGVILGFSVNRRSRFTLACAALCLLLAATAVVRDAEWIVVLCLMAGGAVCVAGLVNGRTLPAFVLACMAWPLAGLRGLPWLGRSAQAVRGLRASAPALRTVLWSLLGVVASDCCSPRPMRSSRSGRAWLSRTWSLTRSCCARFSPWLLVAWCWRRRTSG